eukprot:tig00000123_g6902.t1
MSALGTAATAPAAAAPAPAAAAVRKPAKYCPPGLFSRPAPASTQVLAPAPAAASSSLPPPPPQLPAPAPAALAPAPVAAAAAAPGSSPAAARAIHPLASASTSAAPPDPGVPAPAPAAAPAPHEPSDFVAHAVSPDGRLLSARVKRPPPACVLCSEDPKEDGPAACIVGMQVHAPSNSGAGGHLTGHVAVCAACVASWDRRAARSK